MQNGYGGRYFFVRSRTKICVEISVVLSFFEKGFYCRFYYVGKLSVLGNVTVYNWLVIREHEATMILFLDGNAIGLCSNCNLKMFCEIIRGNTQIFCYFHRKCKELCALASLGVYLKEHGSCFKKDKLLTRFQHQRFIACAYLC